MSLLRTRNLSHDYSGLGVLFDVNLDVDEGERHAIIGSNGAGKTTLFNIITGAIRPSSGQVLYKERDVTGLPPHSLTRLGIGRSFQITSTFDRLTTFENLRLAVMSRLGIRLDVVRPVGRIEALNRITDEVVARLELSDERDVPAGQLSYGKGRALEVSLAAATDAELVMLDEPAAGMSKDDVRRAVAFIRRVTEGKTMIIVEHDMDVVFSLADRITVLDQGSILATGTPDAIRNDPEVKKAYLGSD